MLTFHILEGHFYRGIYPLAIDLPGHPLAVERIGSCFNGIQPGWNE